MSRLVVDASAVIELLLRTPAGERVAAAMRGARSLAPAHLDTEVLSGLGRLARAGDVTGDVVAGALTALAISPVRRYPVAPLLAEAWSLRNNVALRDAPYVVLARRLGATLVTMDARLTRTPDLGVTVSIPGR